VHAPPALTALVLDAAVTAITHESGMRLGKLRMAGFVDCILWRLLLKFLDSNLATSLDWTRMKCLDWCLEMSQDQLGLEPEDTKKTLNIDTIEQVRRPFNNETNPSKTRQERTPTVQLTLTNSLGQSPSANLKIAPEDETKWRSIVKLEQLRQRFIDQTNPSDKRGDDKETCSC
jgi:hypothetical protein